MDPLPINSGSVIAQSRAKFESGAATHLPVHRSAVTHGLVFARRFADQADLAPEATDHLALIVEEWLNNVVEHSGATSSGRIGLRLQRRPGVVQLRATDAGKPFDPRTVTFDGPNLARGGGAGLALIQAWCRIADYRRHRGRNWLIFEMPST